MRNSIVTKLLIAFFILASTITKAQVSNWSPVGPNFFPTNVSGQIHGISRVSQMKFHPSNANKIYAVSARGGLFISTNGGSNWSLAPGCDLLPTMSLASICIDHANDQVLYLGTGDHNYYGGGSGVYKSTNGGATFSPTTLTSKLVVDMIMDPLNNQIIVAATNVGIYKTLNGGTTWTLKSTNRRFDDLKQKTPTSRVLYAATTDSAFFRSTDFGETWSQINNGIVLPSGVTTGAGCRVAVTPADTNIVYLAMVGNGGMIYKSVDGGSTFSAIKTAPSPYISYYTNVSTDVGQGDYNWGIGVDPLNANTVYVVAHAVWKSIDGGITWTQLTNWWQKVHTDMHQIIVNPYNASQLWNANDGGVWLSTDGGNNWVPKSDGIYGYEIYHGITSPTRKDMISIGTQDNGELYYMNTGTGWFCNRGGDWGSKCAFDYFPNSQRVYYFDNAQRRNVTGSSTAIGIPRTSFRDIAFYRGYTNLAMVGDSNVYRTTNLSATTPTWTQIGTINKKIMAVHISPADSNRLYVITSDQNIYVSTNALSATPTFTQYALPVSTSNVASVVSIKSNPNVLYAALNNKVYRSANNGATWTNVTFNLPSVNYVKIISDEFFSGNELVMVAGGNAVYFKQAAHTSWTLYSTNLPSRTNINDLSIYDDGTNNTVLRVSMYGRGMWETPINSLRTLSAAIGVSTNTPCIGQSIQFSDLSVGSPTSWLWSLPGGTPNTSTLQNPTVVYNTAGVFQVSLTISAGASSNTITKNSYIQTSGQTLPIIQDFELVTFPPDGWSNLDAAADGKMWTRSTAASGFGTGIGSMTYQNYSLNMNGIRDEVRTSQYNLSGYSNYWLKFDVAHQLYSTSPTYLDSLSVLVSTDCGSLFNTVYVKPGTTLATVPGTTGNFTPTSTQWRTDSVNLNSYANQAIMLSFMNHGHYGNNIYVDNIKIEGQNPTVTLNLKLYLQGFYVPANNGMTAVIDPLTAPTQGDTVSVSLASTIAPYPILFTDRKIVSTGGNISTTFPSAILNNSYYIIVKHRNSIETWSKVPILFNSLIKTLDFSTP
jgi:PKD repeat protein/photosystem II stability/assembly factor-like uncharacterized protein